MDNNQTQSGIGGFLGGIDTLRGWIVDALTESKLGSTPIGHVGLLGTILSIDAALDKYNNSGLTEEDYAVLALDLATALPGTAGLIANDFKFSYEAETFLMNWARDWAEREYLGSPRRAYPPAVRRM